METKTTCQPARTSSAWRCVRSNPKNNRVSGSRIRGSALAEFAPALFMIFIFGLLPVIDAVAIGVDFASTYYLNELQLREAQKLPRSKAIAMSGPIIAGIPMDWSRSVLATLHDDDTMMTSLSYTTVPWTPVGSNQSVNFYFVNIVTTVSFRPCLSVPFFKGVPGLCAPLTITVSGRRPVESNRFLQE